MLVASRNGTVQTNGVGGGMTHTNTVGDEDLLERLEETGPTFTHATRCWSLDRSALPTTRPPSCSLRFPPADAHWNGSDPLSPPAPVRARPADAIRAVYVEGMALMRERFGA
jgi:hypothetical protein